MQEQLNINGVILKRIRFIPGSNVTVYLAVMDDPGKEVFEFADFFNRDHRPLSAIELNRQKLQVQERKRQAEIRMKIAAEKLEAAKSKLPKPKR